MKPITLIGTILVALGILGFVIGGVSWTETESVAEIGDVQITNEEENSVAIPQMASAIAVGAGLIMVIAGVAGGRK